MERIIHDMVNAVNSDNYEFMITVLFPNEDDKRVEKAARFIRRAVELCKSGELSKSGELCKKGELCNSGEELTEMISREEGDRFEDVSKLINDFYEVGLTSKLNNFFDSVTGRGGECVICLEKVNMGSKCKICENVFHNGCLGAAVGMTNKCPLCRTKIE